MSQRYVEDAAWRVPGWAAPSTSLNLLVVVSLSHPFQVVAEYVICDVFTPRVCPCSVSKLRFSYKARPPRQKNEAHSLVQLFPSKACFLASTVLHLVLAENAPLVPEDAAVEPPNDDPEVPLRSSVVFWAVKPAPPRRSQLLLNIPAALLQSR